MEEQSALKRHTPLALLACLSVLGLVVMPSALRPPPDQTNDSAALSPDAPPVDDPPDQIISSFEQAASATAGASSRTEGTEPTAPDVHSPSSTTTTEPPPEEAPAKGQCYGDPPLQTESIYAPGCKPAFVGDNGGATAKNVLADEIRLGFAHGAYSPDPGPVPLEPTPGEDAETRTLRVLGQYFTQRYETYGRRVRFVGLDVSDRSADGQKAAVAQADTEWKVFSSYVIDESMCRELIRRELICYSLNPFSDGDMNAASPYWYSYDMATNRNEALVAELICQQLTGGPAQFGGGDVQDKTRKFGVIYETTYTGRSKSDFQGALSSECGERVVGFDVNDPSVGNGLSEITLAMAQLQQQNVTTIVSYMQVGSHLTATTAADGSGYQPEWIIPGTYGLYSNGLMSLMPVSQASHSYGMMYTELPRAFAESECYLAYKSIDPSNEPSQTICNLFWLTFQQMVIGIHEAGPTLTPESFQSGLYRYGLRPRPEVYAVQGGYQPGDHSFPDKMTIMWWDTEAADPVGGLPGAWRHTDNGARYGKGEVPDQSPLFVDGITRD